MMFHRKRRDKMTINLFSDKMNIRKKNWRKKNDIQ
jgi:hypothetical protein